MRPLEGFRVAEGGPLSFSGRMLRHLGADADNADTSGPDLVLSLESGGSAAVTLHRAPSGVLAGCHPTVVDALTGSHAALAGLAALRIGVRSAGVDELKVIAGCLGEALPAGLCGAAEPERRIAVWRCQDGFVSFSLGDDAARDDIATLAGIKSSQRDDLAEGPRPWLECRTRREVVDEAQAWRLHALPVLSAREARSAGRPAPFWFEQGVQTGPAQAPLGPLPLSGLRVLDLGMMWAGPYCGRLLAGLGAEVIKIEGPKRIDGTRRDAGPCQGVFADLNAGKQSLAVDLGRPQGYAIFRRLVKRTDVVLDNFSPRVMPNFGFAYDSLAAINPRLVVVSMPAFGADSPYANYTAYGSGLELAAGLARWVNGDPRPAPIAYLDYLCGAQAAVATLAALLHRDRTGRGGHVEVRQYEVARELTGPDESGLGYEPRVKDVVTAAATFVHPCEGSRAHLAQLPFRIHGVGRRHQPRPRQLGADSRRVLRRETWLLPGQIRGLIADGTLKAAEA